MATSQSCFFLHWMSCFTSTPRSRSSRGPTRRSSSHTRYSASPRTGALTGGMGSRRPPDTLGLLNMDDAHHLECLTWAVYDGTLLVGHGPNFQEIVLGVQCWLGCISISTGATMMRPIARHTC